MPSIYYCPRCYRREAAGQPPLSQFSAVSRIICRDEDQHFIVSRTSTQTQSMRSTPSRAQTLERVGVNDLDRVLSDWIRAGESEKDKSNRRHAATAMKNGGVTYDRGRIVVKTTLTIQLAELKKLPDNLHVKGDLVLVDCFELDKLPQNLKLDGVLCINSNDKLKEIPDNLDVSGKVTLSECRRLESLPKDFKLKSDLFLYKCNALKKLPEKMTVNGHCDIIECTQLTSLPKKQLTVGGELKATDCLRLSQFPEKMSIGRDLDFENCRAIQSLPESLLNLGFVMDNNRFSSRKINIKGTSLPFALEENLVNNPPTGLRFLTGPSSHTVSAKVEVVPGDEMTGILNHFDQFPRDDIFIKYKDMPGIDQGGLSRQAFSNALQQLFQHPNGMFEKIKGKYQFKDIEITPTGIGRATMQSRDFGRILARFNKLQISVGPLIDDAFYHQLFDAIHFILKQSRDVSINDVISVLSSVNGKDADLNKAIDLLADISPAKYSGKGQKDYLHTLDAEDLMELTVPVGMYLTMGLSYLNANNPNPQSAKALQALLAGPADPRDDLAKALKIRVSKENEKLGDKLIRWSKKAVREADAENVAALSEDLTGSRYISKDSEDIIVRLVKFPEPRVFLNSHSCSFVLDVNIDLFKILAQRDDYTAFARAFVAGSSSEFNEA